MKVTARVSELALRLSLDQDFREFWDLVRGERDRLVTDAIHGEGDPAEKRGAAAAFDRFVTDFEGAPDKAKKLQSMR